MTRELYSIAYIFPLLTIAAFLIGGATLYVLPIITFVAIPLLEAVFSGSTDNISEAESASRQQDSVFYYMLYGMVVLHVSTIALFIYLVSQNHFIGSDLTGAVISAGICCGVFGINIGHELGHRSNAFDQRLAKLMLLTSLYMHFFIEHNRGHHARVSTEEDPASSRKNELVYTFWFRSITMSWISAWHLEKKRLRRKSSWEKVVKNEMLHFQLIQVALLLSIFAIGGLSTMIAFMLAALLGILLLETVNYIEHYGLQRNKKSNGRYERVRPCHSWNSNHSIGRMLLFELSRHSDHHAHPGRKYSALRHFDDSPQFPAGYPSMILLSLVPPLWFAIMNPHLEREMARLDNQEVARLGNQKMARLGN